MFGLQPCALAKVSVPEASHVAGVNGRSRAIARNTHRGRVVLAVAADQVAARDQVAGSSAAASAQLLALKEWAPTCAAIAEGRQTILLRKGGIKEPTFKPAARDFVLFPTSFHTDAQLLKPAAAEAYAAHVDFDPKAQRRLTFATAATVTGAWTTFDPAVLEALDELHVWAPGFLESRLRWRAKQPITVLELRAYRLADPLIVQPQEDFWGCFSWTSLGGSPQAQGLAETVQQGQLAKVGEAALGDAPFAARQQLCRQQLSQLADLQELNF